MQQIHTSVRFQTNLEALAIHHFIVIVAERGHHLNDIVFGARADDVAHVFQRLHVIRTSHTHFSSCYCALLGEQLKQRSVSIIVSEVSDTLGSRKSR